MNSHGIVIILIRSSEWVVLLGQVIQGRIIGWNSSPSRRVVVVMVLMYSNFLHLTSDSFESLKNDSFLFAHCGTWVLYILLSNSDPET